MNCFPDLPESVKALQELQNSPPIQQPLPLIRPMEDANPYPIEQLGEELAPLAEELMLNLQVPGAIVGQSILALCSLLTQPHVNIEINGMVYPSSLFLFTIAESGDRKSAVDSVILHKVTEYEKAELIQYQKDKRAYKSALEQYNREQKSQPTQSKEGKFKPPTEPINPLILV